MKHRLLGRTGLRVSELALGAATFGGRWGHGADAAESAAIFNAYAEAGGNFIDTADIYQFGQSEDFLAPLLDGRREDFFLATKFTNAATPAAARTADETERPALPVA